MLLVQGYRFTPVRSVSEGKAQRQNPAVVILMEFCHRNRHTGADGEAKFFRDWKRAQDETGRQENLFFPIQCPARPKHRVLLEHWPDPPLNFVVDRSIENDGAAENARSTNRKVSAQGGLNIPAPNALGGCESGREDCVIEAIWWSSCRKRATKKESYKVVPAPFGSGMRQIVGWEDADLQPTYGNNFKAL